MDLAAHKARVRERADSLPHPVWHCEVCGYVDAMAIRSSNLNKAAMADDITVKCMECYHTRTHGVPFDDPERFRAELQDRPGRVIDFAQDTDGDGHDRAAQLEALGYTARAGAVREDLEGDE